MTVQKSQLHRLLSEQRGSTALPLLPVHMPHFGNHSWFNSQEPLPHFVRHVRWWIRLQKRQLAYATLSLIGGIGLAYSASFLLPRQLTAGYSVAETCIANPILFPNLLRTSNSNTYSTTYKPTVRIAGQTVFSSTTCVSHAVQPQENTVHQLAASPFGIPLLQNKLSIQTAAFPSVSSTIGPDNRLVAHKPVSFGIDGGDRVFSYRLQANNAVSECQNEEQTIVCELELLGLVQGQSYALTLERLYAGVKVGDVYNNMVTTIEPVVITATSISAGTVVYTAPASVELSFNKPVDRLSDVKLEALSPSGRTTLPVTYELRESSVIVSFGAPLPRETSFELQITQAEATDQSVLAEPYTLPFATSGGPKVSTISIGSYKVTPGASFSITFDSELLATQNVASFVSLTAGSKTLGANVTAAGNRLVVTPETLGKCESFTVAVKAGLVSAAGIGEGQAWQYGSRTTCQTVFSIGTSVQGRSITAYRFGTGNNKIIFVGGTHGDEKSSVYTMNSLVDHLEASPNLIANNSTVIIIPNLNPDGFAQNRRTNANNVDLNRNFPSNNWKQGVTMPGGEYLSNGGGSAPLSEPESNALANYVLAQDPVLVLTYHSSGGMVIANESGNSWDMTYNYGKKTGLWARKNSELGTTFNYDTTGAFEDWLHDKHSIPTLLIELWNDTSNHFNGQKSGLNYIVGL